MSRSRKLAESQRESVVRSLWFARLESLQCALVWARQDGRKRDARRYAAEIVALLAVVLK